MNALLPTPLSDFVREVFTKNKGPLHSRVRIALLRFCRLNPNYTVEQFCFMGREELLHHRNLGKKSYAIIESELRVFGLSLREPGQAMKIAPVWSEETPPEEGWYWMKYKNKRNKYTVCPAYVSHFNDGGTLVKSAQNDVFMEGPNHGGKGLRYDTKIDTSIRFGPKIEEPDDE